MKENHGSMSMIIRRITGIMMALTIMCVFAGAAAETIHITLSDEGSTCDNGAVQCLENMVVISYPGDYEISGTLSDGQLYVNCDIEGKVGLTLNGVSIHNEDGAAVCIGSVNPRAHIILAEGTENIISSGKQSSGDAEESDGAIFSRSDLTIEGTGALKISAGRMDGIVSKDDLRIEGGTIEVDALRHGIRGKDAVEISGGEITVSAGKDGIRSNNDKDAGRGYITITGGDIHISCGDDPLDFVTALTISGGTVDSAVISPEDR